MAIDLPSCECIGSFPPNVVQQKMYCALLAIAGLLNTGSTVPAGTVVQYAGANVPAGWLLAYGQAVERALYPALFAAIGTTYGAGNGTTTFNVPDFRGRVGAGKDDMGGVAANRLVGYDASGPAGSVADGAILGSAGGEEGHTLTASVSRGGTGEQGDLGGGASDGATGGSANYYGGIEAAATLHNTVQPTLVVNVIIKT